jgi:hypothetical protein
MPVPSEWDIQRAFTLYYKGDMWAAGPLKGTWKIIPAKLPAVVAWHTPLGGTRNAVEGLRLKQSGAEAGLHDYFFLHGGLYGLEFKKPNGRPPETQLSPVQRAMHPRLLAAGMVASATVDSLDAAKAFVRLHGLIQPGL